jgi:hypothetical protein
MNEHHLPGVDQASEYREHQGRLAQRAGIEAIERELTGERTDAVEISLWVRGREIRTTTDDATVRRIMAILTGLEA